MHAVGGEEGEGSFFGKETSSGGVDVFEVFDKDGAMGFGAFFGEGLVADGAEHLEAAFGLRDLFRVGLHFLEGGFFVPSVAALRRGGIVVGVLLFCE